MYHCYTFTVPRICEINKKNQKSVKHVEFEFNCNKEKYLTNI